MTLPAQRVGRGVDRERDGFSRPVRARSSGFWTGLPQASLTLSLGLCSSGPLGRAGRCGERGFARGGEPCARPGRGRVRRFAPVGALALPTGCLHPRRGREAGRRHLRLDRLKRIFTLPLCPQDIPRNMKCCSHTDFLWAMRNSVWAQISMGLSVTSFHFRPRTRRPAR